MAKKTKGAVNRNLVIVESPAKARTLARILGRSYSLKASMGHIRDLPKSRLGVDIENGFNPKYVVPRPKGRVVKELREAAKTASTVYLATDPDREGEAIAWHLTEVTRVGRKPYRRVVFHEITEAAIKHAFKTTRAIDMGLVDAQQARRILDRLVGYKISPLLWRKVRRGLSAGRVQSVALRIIVEREREISRFTPEEYWIIEAELNKKGVLDTPSFRARFIGLADGARLEVRNQEEASEICDVLKEAGYRVVKVTIKKVTRQPAPPFITSTLQQEAWRKLRFSAKQTMAIAQQLYEGLPIGDEGSVGLITYMRTDSPRVSRAALAETREFITTRYGAEYLPPHARSFTAVKGAQEAHEAIRPTKVWREPSLVKQYLSTAQSRLYQLIWQRMVASQMQAALFENTTVDIEAKHPASSTKYLFRTQSSVNTFPGFMILYTAGRDEDEAEDRKGSLLPQLEKGDSLELLGLFPEQRFTQPPPRFTEATLIKTLEQWGIGRPSTYAPILSTIQEREYVTKVKGCFEPTELGFVVTDLLTRHFPNIVNIEFTAQMEEELDEIADKKREWVNVVQGFYTPFEKSLESASRLMDRVKLADELTEEACPQCGKPLVVKTGRYGKFLACSGYPDCKFTKSHQVRTGVSCPECGSELVERISRKKRTFYGCSNYPNCQFATNQKPLPRPCPRCGGLLTQYRGKWEKCAKCDYKGRLEERNGLSIGAPA
jgi:DNA topoisomerase-1